MWKTLVAVHVMVVMVLAKAGTADEEQISESPRQLFAMARSSDQDLPSRIESAEELARHPGGAAWVIIILTDVDWSRGTEKQDRRSVALEEVDRQADAAIVALVLRMLSENKNGIHPEVMWAVTSRLEDGRTGLYSKTIEDLDSGRRIDILAATKPVREVALELLQNRTGEAYGYDAERWREYILGLNSK